jgi:hypothetical protein
MYQAEVRSRVSQEIFTFCQHLQMLTFGWYFYPIFAVLQTIIIINAMKDTGAVLGGPKVE